MFNLDQLLRENIRRLVPHSFLHDGSKHAAGIFLDANENAFGSPVDLASASIHTLNRYPDPLQAEVKEKLSKIKGVPAGNIFLGNGSGEVIDLLYRCFCNPGRDNVILVPPTHETYEVSAAVNDVEVRKVPLLKEFQLDIEGISEAVGANTKLIFICSPNDPTGNSMDREDVEFILNNFEGLVIVDEAYINYSRQRSFISELTEYPNLVVMQTMSKAWGMAGVRVGMAYASDEIIAILNTVKLPYNVGGPAQQLMLKALDHVEQVNEWIRITVQERSKLVAALGQLQLVKKIYPSDANFLLVKVDEAAAVANYLLNSGIVVRNCSEMRLCDECLRITIGTPEENEALLKALAGFKRTV